METKKQDEIVYFDTTPGSALRWKTDREKWQEILQENFNNKIEHKKSYLLQPHQFGIFEYPAYPFIPKHVVICNENEKYAVLLYLILFTIYASPSCWCGRFVENCWGQPIPKVIGDLGSYLSYIVDRL